MQFKNFSEIFPKHVGVSRVQLSITFISDFLFICFGWYYWLHANQDYTHRMSRSKNIIKVLKHIYYLYFEQTNVNISFKMDKTVFDIAYRVYGILVYKYIYLLAFLCFLTRHNSLPLKPLIYQNIHPIVKVLINNKLTQ